MKKATLRLLFPLSSQDILNRAFRILQEAHRYPVMVRILEADAFNAFLPDLVNLRIRKSQEHGRMRGDNEL